MYPGVDRAVGADMRDRDRLGRSIIQSQLVTSAAVLLLSWIVVLVSPATLGEPLFFGGLTLIFAVTAIALTVRWSTRNKQWAIILPLLDIVALVALREASPELGSGILLVFPVIWLARNFKLIGAIGGVLLSSVLIWFSWFLTGTPIAASDFPSLVLLPITLSFVSATSHISGRRTSSQRSLLTQQNTLIEQAFERARLQETLLQETLDAVEFGVMSFDARGSITLINESHRRSLNEFGAPRGALIHPVSYLPDRVTQYPEASRPWNRAVRGEAYENVVIWVGRPGSRQAAFSITSRRLRGADGSDRGGTLVLRDVTAELEAINARDSLIGSVSHELRTPLTSILGYLELALDDPGMGDDTKHMIEVSYRNAERLAALVADLLLAASTADSTLPVTMEVTNLSDIVSAAVSDQRVDAAERDITITERVASDVSAEFDPLRIRQVMDNLLSNAIKYNRLGGKITVSLATRDHDAVISVLDTGLGISPPDLAQLFDRFFRTESARSSTTVGTGLGLGITRDIVRRHGGDLVVTSDLGVGSIFTVTLPLHNERQAP